MLKKDPQQIQELLKGLGALHDREGGLIVPDPATNVQRYYWRPSFGWVEVKNGAGPGRPANLTPIFHSGIRKTTATKTGPARTPAEAYRERVEGNATVNLYTMKQGRTTTGKKVGRPRKYFRGDGFDV